MGAEDVRDASADGQVPSGDGAASVEGGGADAGLCLPGCSRPVRRLRHAPARRPRGVVRVRHGAPRGRARAHASASRPRALSATVRADAGDNPVARLLRWIPGPATAVDCRWRLRPEAMDSAGLIQFATLTFRPPPGGPLGEATIELRVLRDVLDLRLGGAAGGGRHGVLDPVAEPRRSAARSVALDALPRSALGGTNARLEVWLGEARALDETVTLPSLGTAGVEGWGVVGSVPGRLHPPRALRRRGLRPRPAMTRYHRSSMPARFASSGSRPPWVSASSRRGLERGRARRRAASMRPSEASSSRSAVRSPRRAASPRRVRAKCVPVP